MEGVKNTLWVPKYSLIASLLFYINYKNWTKQKKSLKKNIWFWAVTGGQATGGHFWNRWRGSKILYEYPNIVYLRLCYFIFTIKTEQNKRKAWKRTFDFERSRGDRPQGDTGCKKLTESAGALPLCFYFSLVIILS